MRGRKESRREREIERERGERKREREGREGEGERRPGEIEKERKGERKRELYSGRMDVGIGGRVYQNSL